MNETKNYKATIGLEIHAELKTKTKMFCDSRNDPEEKRPNVNICPVCMAHPGTLPVINKEAVKHVVKVGLALRGNIADFTEFDRKNYFYPDIPKGYQISQYKYPLVSGGSLNGVAITRVHLEEDTARSTHDRGDYTLIDFNRAGIPLMELVTEPVVKSAEEASAFARELQLLLRYLGASDANMEKGEMRVEANVSVKKDLRGYKERISADENAGNLLYEELTYKIRGAAFTVYNKLGHGHKESVYQNSLEEEFKKDNIPYQREKSIAVVYEGKKAGSYQPDFVIDGKVVLEIKSLPFVGKIEHEQVRHYIKGSLYRLALLINFGSNPIHIERVVYDHIRDNPRQNQQESASLGTKVEVKNLNSFKVVEKAIDYEIKRQIELIESGGEVAQETRGWDEAKQETFSQRAKESSHEYRYFPDPDLPKLKLSEIPDFSPEVLRKEMPELPWDKRGRLLKDFGLKNETAELFVQNAELGKFFEDVVAGKSADFVKLAANYITSDLVSLMKNEAKTGQCPAIADFRALIDMVISGKLSSRGAKDTLAIMYQEGGNPEEIAKSREFTQESDEGKLKEIVEKIISGNPDAVREYKNGREASLQFLIGQGMKEARGSANPQVLKKLFLAGLK